MKLLLTLVFACLLAGCTKSDVKPQPTAKPSDCREFWFTSKGKICMSEPSLWLNACAPEVYNKGGNQLHDGTIFVPQADPVEEIFQQCNSVKPLSADKVPVYKKWLQDRILEIQSITPGTTRKKVNQILQQNGGLTTRDSAIYSNIECIVLKVRIEFEPAPNETGDKKSHLNENDKVIYVSMPYLGFFIAG